MFSQDGQNVDIKIEAEEPCNVVISFDRHIDCILMPTQEGRSFGDHVGNAALAISNPGDIWDPASIIREQEKFKLHQYHNKLAIIFDWCSYIRMHWRAALIVSRAIKVKTQDIELAQRGLFLSDPKGFIPPQKLSIPG